MSTRPLHGPKKLALSTTANSQGLASARSAKHQIQLPDAPEYLIREPSLSGLFPNKPGTYTLDDLRLHVLGMDSMVLPRDKLKSLTKTEVRTVINGDFTRRPDKGCTVVVNYIAFYSNETFHGKMWDSTYNRSRPLKFRVGCRSVFRGLEEAVCMMTEGQKAVAYIPPEAAFGARGFPSLVPGNAHLILWVVLEEILPFGHEQLRHRGINVQ